MKRIVMFLTSTITAVVLLFGYHTSTSSKATAQLPAAIAPAQTGSTTTKPATTTAAATASAATTSAAGSGTSTVTGDVTQTRWGPVQVQLTVTGGRITAVDVVQYPSGNSRDQEINANALPILVDETLTAQNAKIDMVSGATVTSDGYLTSLQSALDKAGL